MGERLQPRVQTVTATKLTNALSVLLEGHEYAIDTGSDSWRFAISIRSLRRLGLNQSDFRWLVCKGYVAHAREVTIAGDDGRQFRSAGDLTFGRRSCFILTEAGVAKARDAAANQIDARGEHHPSLAPVELPAGHPSTSAPLVQWDPESRRLRVGEHLVKRFKWPAANQEIVLSAFQEEGWPARIDDPLPPHPDQDHKRRLSDTIKCLNRKQALHLIHFRGDGTGEGVLWELVESGINSRSPSGFSPH